MRKIVVFVLSSVLVLVLVIAYAVVSRDTKKKEPIPPLVVMMRNQLASDDLKNSIQEMDEALEIRVGEGTDFFTVEPYAAAYWEEFIDDPVFSEDRLARLDEQVGVYVYREDIRRVQQLIAIAKQDHDADALVYASRIISDLNGWIFNPDEEKREYWEASETLQWHASKKTIQKITRYIKDHS